MSLLSVDEALGRMLEGVHPLSSETVTLSEAAYRVLAEPVIALRTQPPFCNSAMDGYAIRAADVETVPAVLQKIGVSSAGHGFKGSVGPGQAVRIFTGAPLPEGADTILIQENAAILPEGGIEAQFSVDVGRHIRKSGLDFNKGDVLFEAGRQLDPAALALAASAGHPHLSVVRRPKVAIISTGDELVLPGTELGPDQIIASNSYAIAALAGHDGAEIIDLGIVPDNKDDFSAAIDQARKANADIIITLGGASVGDHDLALNTLTDQGMKLGFWKIAMRPGKPLIYGRLGSVSVLGLPGNPVSSYICAHLFLRPLLARMCGRIFKLESVNAELGAPMPANDTRRDYVRATVTQGPRGLVATPFEIQDSSMLRLLAAANALIIRQPEAPAAAIGERCQVLILR